MRVRHRSSEVENRRAPWLCPCVLILFVCGRRRRVFVPRKISRSTAARLRPSTPSSLGSLVKSSAVATTAHNTKGTPMLCSFGRFFALRGETRGASWHRNCRNLVYIHFSPRFSLPDGAPRRDARGSGFFLCSFVGPGIHVVGSQDGFLQRSSKSSNGFGSKVRSATSRCIASAAHPPSLCSRVPC